MCVLYLHPSVKMTCDRETNVSPRGQNQFLSTEASLSSWVKNRENTLDEYNHVTRSNDSRDPLA